MFYHIINNVIVMATLIYPLCLPESETSLDAKLQDQWFIRQRNLSSMRIYKIALILRAFITRSSRSRASEGT